MKMIIINTSHKTIGAVEYNDLEQVKVASKHFGETKPEDITPRTVAVMVRKKYLNDFKRVVRYMDKNVRG